MNTVNKFKFEEQLMANTSLFRLLQIPALHISNNKGTHSVLLLAVCDAHLQVIELLALFILLLFSFLSWKTNHR